MTIVNLEEAIDDSTYAVRTALGEMRPRIAIILGSGLGGLAERVTDAVRIPYRELAGFHEPRVPGHKGELVGGPHR